MTRLAAPETRDTVVFLTQAAATGPPWLAIVLAAIGVLSAVGVALAPAVVEKVKRGANPPAAGATTPPAVEGSVDLVREAMTDLRSERDEAQLRAERLTEQLEEARLQIGVLQVELARRDARIETLLDRLGRGRS